MSELNENKISWKERLSKDYKLVIFRSEDFQEIKSFNLTLGNLYVIFSTVVLIISIAIISVMAFTPVKRLIPGYGKIEANQHFITLVDSIQHLAQTIESQQVYLDAFNTMLTGGNLPEGPLDIALDEIPKVNNRSSVDLVPDNTQPQTLQPVELPPRNYAYEDIYLAIEDERLIPPVDGVVSSNFQPEIKHYGIDILAPKNTPIRSIMDGFIFSSGWDLETGYTIGIQHGDNILSFYKHNSILLKEKGTFVRAGEAVAIIGNTGTLSSGPHLHFELWHSGKPVNPEDFIKFNL